MRFRYWLSLAIPVSGGLSEVDWTKAKTMQSIISKTIGTPYKLPYQFPHLSTCLPNGVVSIFNDNGTLISLKFKLDPSEIDNEGTSGFCIRDYCLEVTSESGDVFLRDRLIGVALKGLDGHALRAYDLQGVPDVCRRHFYVTENFGENAFPEGGYNPSIWIKRIKPATMGALAIRLLETFRKIHEWGIVISAVEEDVELLWNDFDPTTAKIRGFGYALRFADPDNQSHVFTSGDCGWNPIDGVFTLETAKSDCKSRALDYLMMLDWMKEAARRATPWVMDYPVFKDFEQALKALHPSGDLDIGTWINRFSDFVTERSTYSVFRLLGREIEKATDINQVCRLTEKPRWTELNVHDRSLWTANTVMGQWNEIGGPTALSWVAVSPHCEKSLISFIIGVACSLPALDEVTGPEFATESKLDHFCNHHSSVILNHSLLVEERAAPLMWAVGLPYLCRELVLSSRDAVVEITRLGAYGDKYNPGRALGRSFYAIPIARKKAFKDSMDVLTRFTLSLDTPLNIRFIGENRVKSDAETAMDWFEETASIILDPESSDPAGGLLNPAKPFTEETSRYYYGFGRFLAFAVLQKHVVAALSSVPVDLLGCILSSQVRDCGSLTAPKIDQIKSGFNSLINIAWLASWMDESALHKHLTSMV